MKIWFLGAFIGCLGKGTESILALSVYLKYWKQKHLFLYRANAPNGPLCKDLANVLLRTKAIPFLNKPQTFYITEIGNRTKVWSIADPSVDFAVCWLVNFDAKFCTLFNSKLKHRLADYVFIYFYQTDPYLHSQLN